MTERISETLQKKLSERLGFYEDLGISLFYRDRCAVATHDRERQLESPVPANLSTPDLKRKKPCPGPQQTRIPKSRTGRAATESKDRVLPVAAGPSLFEAVDKIADDTLLKVRQDLGDAHAASCTARGTQLFLATEIPGSARFCRRSRAPTKTRKDCRSLAARGNF